MRARISALMVSDITDRKFDFLTDLSIDCMNW